MRRLLRIAGLVVTLLAVAYVVGEILRQDVIAGIDWQPRALFQQFGPGVLAYGLASLGLAVAWTGLLAAWGDGRVRPLDAIGAYALTQLNKYLPSNLMHLAGRHVMLRRAGASHAALVWAAVAEIVLLLSVALATALVGSRDLVVRLLAPGWWLLALAAVAAAVAVALAWPRLSALLDGVSLQRVAVAATAAVAVYVIFFLVSAGIVRHLLLEASQGEPAIGLAMMTALICLAWSAGFIVPGSAAGFGVRESVLILTLGPLAGEQAATLVAAGFRIVTLAGDVLLFAFGAIWWAVRRNGYAAAHV